MSKVKSISKYVYRERTAQDWQKNQNSYKGFDGDTFLTDTYKTKLWRPKEGENTIRILPPAQSWMNYGHYGLRIKRHTGIGPKMAAFLCHDFDGLDGYVEGREPGKCPVCLYNAHARKDHNDELSKTLYAKSACLVWMIDRDNMKEGPKLWIMPSKTVDLEICSRAYNAKRNKAKAVDHPEAGYDISFHMEKVGSKYPNYTGIELDTDPTPIVEDEERLQKYLEFVEANPLPVTLKYHPTQYILEVLQGAYEEEGVTPTKSVATKPSKDEEAWGGSSDGEQNYDGPEKDVETISKAVPPETEVEEKEEPVPTAPKKPAVKQPASEGFGEW